VLVLANEMATGLQPPGLSATKLAVNCAVVLTANNTMHASRVISLLYFTGKSGLSGLCSWVKLDAKIEYSLHTHNKGKPKTRKKYGGVLLQPAG
jgi:hypothetical protein